MAQGRDQKMFLILNLMYLKLCRELVSQIKCFLRCDLKFWSMKMETAIICSFCEKTVSPIIRLAILHFLCLEYTTDTINSIIFNIKLIDTSPSEDWKENCVGCFLLVLRWICWFFRRMILILLLQMEQSWY